MLCRNEEGTWDTPDAARLLMRTVAGRHATTLADLPWTPSEPDTLLDSFRGSTDSVAALLKGVQQHRNVCIH
jgi:hypothetical protein